jgi:hypothetical protein
MRIFNLIVILITFLFSQTLYAQHITGTVYDLHTGKPLPGANVMIPETKQGTVTDNYGNFAIAVPGIEKYLLKISYVGYTDTTLKVLAGSNVKVFMSSTSVVLSEIYISGNRHEQEETEIIARASVIKSDAIEFSPFNNIDEALILLPGIHSDRDQGIFSRNAGVTMRGMNSTARVLVLLNGIPINKADGGGINWNRVNPEQVDRIEVIKGPASSIYGGNAMAGVINILTLKPQDRFSLSTKFFGGTFNTIGNTTLISGNHRKRRERILLDISYLCKTG